MNFKHLIQFILVLIFSSSCNLPQREDNLPAYGLTKIEITMDAESLGDLNNSVGGKRPFPAMIRVDGKQYWTEVSYTGQSTLFSYKKSWEIDFRGEKFRGRSSYRLASQKLDETVIRSKIGFETFELNGIWSPKTEEVSVYLNGDYLGLHILTEPIDKEFFEVRGARVADLYKAKFGNADFDPQHRNKMEEGFDVKTKPKSYAAMRTLYDIVSDWEQINGKEKIKEILDVEQYLRYIAVAVYLNHVDGFDNNYFLARFERDGKFRIFPWDLDRIYEKSKPYQLGSSLWGENQLTKRLLSEPEWRKIYLENLNELVRSQNFEVFEEKILLATDRIADAYQADRLLKELSLQGVRDDFLGEIEKWLISLEGDLRENLTQN